MLKKLLLLLSIAPCITNAQLALDHFYEYQEIKRVILPISGEKYYGYKSLTSSVEIYNSDYSLWKSIPLANTLGQLSVYITGISENIFDNDPDIEVTYCTRNQIGPPGTGYLQQENGTTLMTFPNVSDLGINTQDGLAPKLVATVQGYNDVYSVPALALEHTYISSVLYRKNFEISGEKYYVYNVAGNSVDFYNPDHSLWKSVPAPSIASTIPVIIDFASETLINANPDMELAYHYYDNNNYFSKIISEDGSALASYPNVTSWAIDKLPGFPTKLFGYTSQGTEVINPQTLQVEHIYPGTLKRTNLEISGEKYFTVAKYGDTYTLEVSNPDHTLWKSVVLPIPYDSTVPESAKWISSVSVISETSIEDDSDLEIVYSVTDTYNLYINYYTGFVMKENGTVLNTIPDMFAMEKSQPNDTDLKFIASLAATYASWGQIQGSTKIFVPGNAAGLEDFSKSFAVYPNPFSGAIHFESGISIHAAQLFDLSGRCVARWSGPGLTSITTADVQPGIYILNLQHDKGSSVFKMIKK